MVAVWAGPSAGWKDVHLVATRVVVKVGRWAVRLVDLMET